MSKRSLSLVGLLVVAAGAVVALFLLRGAPPAVVATPSGGASEPGAPAEGGVAVAPVAPPTAPRTPMPEAARLTAAERAALGGTWNVAAGPATLDCAVLRGKEARSKATSFTLTADGEAFRVAVDRADCALRVEWNAAGALALGSPAACEHQGKQATVTAWTLTPTSATTGELDVELAFTEPRLGGPCTLHTRATATRGEEP